MNSTTTLSHAAARKPGPLVNRDFGWLWGGQSLSVTGNAVFTTTLVVWVAVLTAGQSWSPLAVSGVFLCSGVPTMLFGPFAGVFVDRWDKRRTMMLCDGLRALLAAGLVALPLVPQRLLPLGARLAVIFGGVALMYVLAQLFMPAFIALTADVVPPEQQPRAMGMVQAAFSLGMLIGPAIGAPLYFAVGPSVALLFNAATFAVSVLTLRLVRAPAAARSVARGERGHFAREFGTGLRFFFGTPLLVAILLAAMIVMLGGGAITTLNYFFVTQNLHAAPSLYGLMEAASGLGLLIGTLVLGLIAQRVGLARLLWMGLFVGGLLTLAYARMTSFVPAMVLVAVSGVAIGAVNVTIAPMIMRVTPRELMGRTAALLDPVIMIATIIGTALAGYLDGVALRGFSLTVAGVHFGPVDSVFLGAGALFVVGALVARAAVREPPLPARPDEVTPVAEAAAL